MRAASAACVRERGSEAFGKRGGYVRGREPKSSDSANKHRPWGHERLDSLPTLRDEPPVSVAVIVSIVGGIEIARGSWWPPQEPKSKPLVFLETRHIEVGR